MKNQESTVVFNQKAASEEFYATVDLQDSELQQKLADWQDFYDELRLHSSLKGKHLGEMVRFNN